MTQALFSRFINQIVLYPGLEASLGAAQAIMYGFQEITKNNGSRVCVVGNYCFKRYPFRSEECASDDLVSRVKKINDDEKFGERWNYPQLLIDINLKMIDLITNEERDFSDEEYNLLFCLMSGAEFVRLDNE